ncbi:MAG TPA: phosphatase PAP2 family protein [Pseudomonas sp.]|uniref:phosphatase PAP2 family protein n=1 Tax=Pseudomonas sp. TaxID=306 RepID=UPI002B493D91|nr:phosphatase PAP2 family protein [Pseudomonas sp.]HKS11503.1 phosphatase PAP2 family protein [Pseudomonas sp.]
MQRSGRTAFYTNNLGLPLLLAAVVFVLFDMTHLDQQISNLLLDPGTGEFIMRHNPWFEKATHKWPRILPNWTGELAVIGSLLSFVWPLLAKFPQLGASRFLQATRIGPVLRFTTRYRRDFLYLVVTFALCTGVIHYLKSHTGIYCPVETTLYGGAAPHKEWFSSFTWLDKAPAGRCWPGGHASSAFTLLAVYFVALRYRWPHARKLLIAVLLLGFVYGTTRVVQGWHYMSHTFWAGIFVWLTAWVSALMFYGRPALQGVPRGDESRIPVAVVDAA